jgi:uncharacterized phage protein gp47/JayE
LQEINGRIQADIVSGFGVTNVVRRSFVAVLSRAYAGACHLLYGFLDFVSRQVFPDTAEDEYLIRWCSLYGIYQTSAVYAAGSVIFTGSQYATIAAGTKIRRSDGVLFSTTADVEIDMYGNATANVLADEAGTAGNTAAGQTLALVSPLAGVNSTVTAGGITGGVDQETLESMRARLIERLQNPPQGGARRDYEQWSLAVAGVTRCWVSEGDPGWVKVLFATDKATNGSIPDATAITTLQAALDDKKPLTARVQVVAPTAHAVPFAIQVWPNTTEVHDAVRAEIQALLIQKGGPGETIFLSHIHEAISAATGEERHNILNPTADIVIPAWKIATIGSIAWVAV